MSSSIKILITNGVPMDTFLHFTFSCYVPDADCNDHEVLKAFNVGLTVGASSTTFSPNMLLNREQAATMLTRVYKKVTMEGRTIDTDSQFKLDYTKPAPFVDDNLISDWAKDSVYFMVAKDIIKGIGGNKFAPKNTTTAEEASNYANATREQALIIAAKMVENLKSLFTKTRRRVHPFRVVF